MKIGVLFGGKSVEHDISIITAFIIMKHLNHEVIPLYLDEENNLFTGKKYLSFENYNKIKAGKVAVFTKKGIYTTHFIKLDAVIVCSHGNNLEDGHIASVMDFYDIPYSSCDIYSSVMIQDKIIMKEILKNHKILTPKYEVLKEGDNLVNLDYPVIIKSPRLGSSIGISICENQEELKRNLEKLFLFHDQVIAEELIKDFKEVSIACVKINDNYLFSHIEEIRKDQEFFDFKNKYELDRKDQPRIFDNLSFEIMKKVKEIGIKLYDLFNCFGIVRIDLFIKNEMIYVCELNAIPGSLSIPLYQGLIKENELLDVIIKNSLKRFENTNENINKFSTNILKKVGSKNK